jgi:archaellum component FlaC
MMNRLNQIEEGIGKARKHLENHMRNNVEVNEKLEGLTNKLEKIEKEEGGYHYRGNQEDLAQEMEDFDKMLKQL